MSRFFARLRSQPYPPAHAGPFPFPFPVSIRIRLYDEADIPCLSLAAPVAVCTLPAVPLAVAHAETIASKVVQLGQMNRSA